MVVIPAGGFQMGSPSSEKDRDGDEGPQRLVTFKQSFSMGKYEVTLEEYDVFAETPNRSRPSDNGWGRGKRPVINVSWYDAKAYVKWLSERTGKSYRLPSESEWEYGTRAGTTTRYWWGKEIGSNRANCNGCGSRWDYKQPAIVGSFASNPFGLHDLHGNVWEWVEDCSHQNYKSAPTDGSPWVEGRECSPRVLRGGSWFDIPENLRSASRYNNHPSVRNNFTGFRVARDLP